MTFDEALADCPIVAILRGVRPDEIEAHAEALYAAGVRILEVPLNSPDPFHTLERLTAAFGDRVVCGSGTVLSPEQVDRVARSGGRIVVSPNTNPAVIARTVEQGLEPLPGFQSATEAFVAVEAGARVIKLFPAGSVGVGHLKALKAVLPPTVRVLAVGGAGPANMAEWWSAGARGFGLGSELYKPGQSPEETAAKAQAAVAAAGPLANGGASA
jgi:2-dehydro-3-deoxyphosphogalactonate aldolase